MAYRFQAMRPGNVDWRADSQAMVFTHNNTLFELTTGNWRLKTLATDVKGVGSVHYPFRFNIAKGGLRSCDVQGQKVFCTPTKSFGEVCVFLLHISMKKRRIIGRNRDQHASVT